MAVKYVKDFSFDRGFGFTGSVQRYAKGGHVTKVPAKAKPAAKGMPARAKPNAPAKGAKRMESPPKVGKGQGYKDGGKVPGKQMDRQPTKTPPGRQKDLARAKPFRGPKQGYAEGGDVQDPRFASIEPGAGSPLDAGAPPTMKTFDYSEPSRPISLNQYGEADPYGDRPVRDISVSPYEGRQVPLNQYGEADPFEGRPVRYENLTPIGPPPSAPVAPEMDFSEVLRRDRERMRNDAAQQMRDFAEIPVKKAQQQNLTPIAPVSTERKYVEEYDQPQRMIEPPRLDQNPPNMDWLDAVLRRDRERMRNDAAQQMRDLGELRALPVQTDEDRARMVLDKYAPERGGKSIEPAFPPPNRPYDPGVVEPLEPSPYRPVDELMRGEPQMYKAAGPGPSIAYEDPAFYQNYLRRMQAEQNEPPMARAVRNVGANRAVGLSDIMRATFGQGMMRRPGMPRVDMYAKGGHVKGQAKVGKVMGEYKRGELHSGSKKGPLVKNPKQAVAIALSEARKSGAKIAKKAEGGLSDKELGGKSFAGRNEPLRGRYVSREEKIMREAIAKEKQKDMERKMREAYERTQSQSVSGLKKGGMARKGVPTHKGKAMYGGGKC